jgi:hypothetical protein
MDEPHSPAATAKRGSRQTRDHHVQRTPAYPIAQGEHSIPGRAESFAVSLTAGASAAGPGGWDHLGAGAAPGSASLNGAVRAFNAAAPGTLYVGGAFTGAGSVTGADHIATWDGTKWGAVGAPPVNGDVDAIAVSGGRIFVVR